MRIEFRTLTASARAILADRQRRIRYDDEPFVVARRGARRQCWPAPGRWSVAPALAMAVRRAWPSFVREPAFVALCLAILAWSATEAEAAPRGHHIRPRSFLFDPFFDDGFYGPVIPELPPPSGYPPIFNVPEDDGTNVYEAMPRPQSVPSPYPQGFSLDVPVVPVDDGSAPPPERARLNTYRAVADALGRCWRPPVSFSGQRWNSVTLRVSFKRDGTVNGVPRIPYADPGLTADARSGLNQSLTAALQRCTPLTLTPSLGSAIAGQIFALRFIEQEPPHDGQPQDPDARNHQGTGGDPPAS